VRVIAGSAGSVRLGAVPGEGTRAITDRVKTALFSILNSQDRIEARNYLDLFAGTGAVGIEALSRGAARVVFCERSRPALRVLGDNLSRTRLASSAVVVPGDAFAYLERPASAGFDVIYVAPPQYQGLWLKALRGIDAHPELLAPGGLVVIQVFPKEWEATELAHLGLLDRRQYGSTLLCFYGRTAAIAG
jgi:16S rRNA (guanine966-N2)-methyltransferase